MSSNIEFFFVVTKSKRMYLPKSLKEGEPIKITIEKVINEDLKKTE